MSEMVPETSLDRLHWLLDGKPTSSQFEDLGSAFHPQFHFMALLPVASLPAGEATKVRHYFDLMVDALVPVRDLIAAYCLRGVMSRTPVSDFSLELQFSDPHVVDMVRRSLPRELAGSAVSHRRYENTPTMEAEGSMFFRDKNRQENLDQPTSELVPVQSAAPMPVQSAAPMPAQNAAPVPAQNAAPVAESAPVEAPARVVAIQPLPPPAVLPQPVYTAPIVAPMPVRRESSRKKMVVAEGITLQGGDILGCAHLAIEGEAYSTIDRCEKFEVLENGIFKGSASVAEAEISGFCQGTLVVKGTLRITGTGHVVGTIQYGRLQVEDGGRIEGEMKMPLNGKAGQDAEPSENPRWVDLNAKVSA